MNTITLSVLRLYWCVSMLEGLKEEIWRRSSYSFKLIVNQKTFQIRSDSVLSTETLSLYIPSRANLHLTKNISQRREKRSKGGGAWHDGTGYTIHYSVLQEIKRVEGVSFKLGFKNGSTVSQAAFIWKQQTDAIEAK